MEVFQSRFCGKHFCHLLGVVFPVRSGVEIGAFFHFRNEVYDLWKSRDVLTATALPMISVGFIVSFFSALVVVRWLLHYVSKHDFSPFGWYRIFFGGVILLTWWTGLVQW